MRKRLIGKGLFMAVVIVGLFVLPGVLSAQGNSGSANIVPGSFICQVSDLEDPFLIGQQAVKATGGRLGHVYEHGFRGFSIWVPLGIVRAHLRAQRGVSKVESNLIMHTCEQTVPTGVARIGGTANVGADCSGIGIAIIDTGIDVDHPDLYVLGGVHYYSINTGPPSRRGAHEDDNYDDDNGHGSHCAGIAAARNNDIGVVGVAPGAQLYAVKVLDSSGSGYLSDIIAGIDWVTANAGSIDVANMSLGGQGISSAYQTAIQLSVNAGVTYVVAAGNSGMDVDGPDGEFGTSDDFIPAAYSGEITGDFMTISALADSDGLPGGVGGMTSYGPDDSFAPFSNYSAAGKIDLMLPGVDIYSTVLGGGYGDKSGTSMASPHAAGLVALAKAGYATGSVAQYSSCGLAVFNDIDGDLEDIGWATEGGCTLPPVDYPPTVNITAPLDGGTVDGLVTLKATAADDVGVDQVDFRVDGVSIGQGTQDIDGVWSFEWDTKTYDDDSYIVSAIATDTAYQTGSDSVNVVVDNVTDPPPVEESVYIGDLDGTSQTINRNKWRATVYIFVLSADGPPVAPVENATVSGTWNPGVQISGTTDQKGWCTIVSGNIRTGTDKSVTFTVNDVIYGNLDYDLSKNTDLDGDSDGTTITIQKP